jgi:glycosyltransferase involved in cell wall biosynthesis
MLPVEKVSWTMPVSRSQGVQLSSAPHKVEEAVSSGSARNVLFITRTFEYGGAEKHLLDLLNRLSQPGVNVSICCFGHDPYSERLDSKLRVAVTALPETPKGLPDWISFFRKIKPDVVVFIYGWSWCFHWVAPIGAWLAGVPRRYAIQHLVLPANSKQSPTSRWLRRALGHLNLKLSASLLTMTICVSNAVKNSLVREFGFPQRKMKTIHNGVSLLDFTPSNNEGMRLRKQFGIGEDEFLLICTARLSEQKGIDILLKAIALVRQRGLGCKCILIGDGPLRNDLMALAQRLDLSGQVFFEGFRGNVRAYLSAGSAFILTSHQEGLPLAILEAAACGLPCIVTDVGGNTEVVTDRVNGLVVPPGSPDAVADAISFLSTHSQERQQMARMARVRIQQQFDVEKCMTDIKLTILK